MVASEDDVVARLGHLLGTNGIEFLVLVEVATKVVEGCIEFERIRLLDPWSLPRA